MCDSHDDSIADLHRVLGALLDVDLGGVDDDALHDVLVSTGRAEARLAAAKARLLAEWDRRKLWKSNGSLRANVRLGNELGISPETAFVEMRRARKLRSMRHTFETFARGDLSVDHVEMLCRANAGDLADQFPDSEKSLVEACVTQRFAAAARTIKYWRQYADPTVEDRAGSGWRAPQPVVAANALRINHRRVPLRSDQRRHPHGRAATTSNVSCTAASSASTANRSVMSPNVEPTRSWRWRPGRRPHRRTDSGRGRCTRCSWATRPSPVDSVSSTTAPCWRRGSSPGDCRKPTSNESSSTPPTGSCPCLNGDASPVP